MDRYSDKYNETKFRFDPGSSGHLVTKSEINYNAKQGSKNEVFTASEQRMEEELFGDL